MGNLFEIQGLCWHPRTSLLWGQVGIYRSSSCHHCVLQAPSPPSMWGNMLVISDCRGHLYLRAWAAMTRYHRLSGLSKRNLFFIVLMLEVQDQGGNSMDEFWWQPSSWLFDSCLFAVPPIVGWGRGRGKKRGRETERRERGESTLALSDFFFLGHWSHSEGLTLMTLPKPNYLPKATFLNKSHWGSGFQNINFVGI